MKWIAKKRTNSVLGLNLADGQLRAFHVARVKGALEVVKSTTAALTLDLQHPEAELIGREIKNHLDAAGIRERSCVVALPASWIMSQHTKVPELSPEDLNSFLQLEAEKGFPCDLAQLQIARSFCRVGEVAYVTQLAVRKEQIDQLAAVLRAAGLKPVSFSLGLTALQEAVPAAGAGHITVAVEPKGAALLIAAGGGIAAFRTCEATIESEAGENVINAGVVARELRITLEQVPVELRAGLRQLALCGDEAMVRQLTDSLAEWADTARLAITRAGAANRALGEQLAERLAVVWLERGASALEFLPRRAGRWSTLLARYNSKRLATAGFAVAGLLLVAIGAFGWQEFRRWSLLSEWGAMQAQVTELETVQSRIHEFRPWYDTTFHNLSILRRVTECFPDNGSVTAKSFEIHGISSVSITGTARDNAALLRTMEQLRKAREIQSLKVEQIHGKAPLQFTFSFRWNSNSGS